jgi:hypothetical protein
MTVGTDTFQKTTVDTFDEKARTTTNHGGQAFISVNGDGTTTRRGYIHFARPFKLGATIFSATLRLHLLETGTEWNGSHTVTARRVTEPWGEYMETWATAPATVALNSATGSVSGGSDGDLLEIDLTDMMNDVSAGEVWYGVRLEVNTSGSKSFYSAEHPNQTYRAGLDIDWGVIPHAPVNLNPTGTSTRLLRRPSRRWAMVIRPTTGFVSRTIPVSPQTGRRRHAFATSAKARSRCRIPRSHRATPSPT